MEIVLCSFLHVYINDQLKKDYNVFIKIIYFTAIYYIFAGIVLNLVKDMTNV